MQCNSLRNQTIHELAECIARAYVASGGKTDNGSDIYWHTRESVMGIARVFGIKIQEIISYYNTQFGWVDIRQPNFLASNPYWPDTAHPDLIVRDVHDS